MVDMVDCKKRACIVDTLQWHNRRYNIQMTLWQKRYKVPRYILTCNISHCKKLQYEEKMRQTTKKVKWYNVLMESGNYEYLLLNLTLWFTWKPVCLQLMYLGINMYNLLKRSVLHSTTYTYLPTYLKIN